MQFQIQITAILKINSLSQRLAEPMPCAVRSVSVEIVGSTLRFVLSAVKEKGKKKKKK